MLLGTSERNRVSDQTIPYDNPKTLDNYDSSEEKTSPGNTLTAEERLNLFREGIKLLIQAADGLNEEDVTPEMKVELESLLESLTSVNL